jgi:hypothetical protein
MVSTLIILCVSLLSLYLVWTILRPGLPQIKSLEDWETNKHEVDPDVFRVLLDPAEQQYLRQSLPPHEFRVFQRRRTALALRSLELVGENAAMLMKLGQLAKAGENPKLAKEADDLIYGALRLRVNLMFAQPCLRLKWLFPGWELSLPAVELPYAEVLTYVGRILQQRQLDIVPGAMASQG